MLLRIEDIDLTRSRPEFTAGIKEDLDWLGVTWDGDVRVQSEHLTDFSSALDELNKLGVTYPCFCTRREILAEIDRAGEAPQGPDGPLYPQTCRGLNKEVAKRQIANGEPHAVRLDVMKAARLTGDLTWTDRDRGTLEVDPLAYGDFVVARKDSPTSYHLSVVVDDALQGVTLVTRGVDLLAATQPQRILQALLGFPAPEYQHHGLVYDREGKRMAKRDESTTVRSLREVGHSPEEVLDLARRAVRSL